MGRSLCQQGLGAGRCDAGSSGASPGTGAHRRTRHHRRDRHRGRARHRGVAADHGKDPSGSRHHDRDEGRPLAKFRGERQDLEEMAGNLVDNACKWAASQVFIEVRVEPPSEPRPGRGSGSSSMTMAVDCLPPSARRCPGAASAWTNPSPGPGSGFRSWSISPPSMAAALSWATPRSAGCGRNWCCRGSERLARLITWG